MRNPTKKQMQTVIDNFNKVLPIAKKDYQLDMEEDRVSTMRHKCGTVHCVGGWYAVSAWKQDEPGFHNSEGLCFSDGASKMAEDLGFDGKLALETWAEQNHKIWGNKEGNMMFYDNRAITTQ